MDYKLDLGATRKLEVTICDFNIQLTNPPPAWAGDGAPGHIINYYMLTINSLNTMLSAKGVLIMLNSPMQKPIKLMI